MNIFDVSDKLQVSEDKKYANRPLSAIKYIIWHHSASDVDDVDGIARYHVEGHGWPGIGYHIVINREGDALITNKFQTKSYHTGGHNTVCAGICVLGDFTNKLPNEKQKAAIEQIHVLLSAIFGDDVKWRGHGDMKPTACPGEAFYEWLEARGFVNE